MDAVAIELELKDNGLEKRAFCRPYLSKFWLQLFDSTKMSWDLLSNGFTYSIYLVYDRLLYNRICVEKGRWTLTN